MSRPDYLLIALIALVLGIGLLLAIDEPGYTDAYYYFNGGEQLAAGEGFTDPYLWLYLNAPDELPAPSHTYWMPLTSILIAISMSLFGQTFLAAQLPALLLLVGLALFSAWLGATLGGKRRFGWLGAMAVLAGGYYLPFWLSTDAFALYGLVGASTLVMIAYGIQQGKVSFFMAAGVLGALAHLTRNDGLLLVLVGLLLIWWPWRLAPRTTTLPKTKASLVLLGAYGLVMLPWFARNIAAIGAPLPAGGIGTAFLRGYNEIFAYPVEWSLSNFLDWGFANIIESRWQAFVAGGATWLAVEGVVILAPFALWALWHKRQHPIILTFWVYALGLHLMMIIVFAYPGARGGLLHSSVALFPFWMVLGMIGLDKGIEKLAQWRNWNSDQAKMVFSIATLAMILGIGLFFSRIQNAVNNTEADYRDIADTYLPEDAVLMVNSPPTWYYFTDLGGVPLPNTPLERLPEIAEKWCVSHLVLDRNIPDSFDPLFQGEMNPPAFLEEIAHLGQDTEEIEDDVKIYRFRVDCIAPQ